MPILQGQPVTLTGFSTLQKAMIGLEIGVEPTSGGLKKRTGTLTLSTDKWDILTQTAIPTGVRLRDIDPRYQSYMSPGVEIPIALPWGAHPLGPVVIAAWPDPPSIDSPTVSLSLTCVLGFYAQSNPEDDDKSEVELGSAQEFSAVARRLLEAGGVPSGRISLSGNWGYSLCYPWGKEGGSYVSQAGQLAEACGRVLYTDKTGTIRDAKPSFSTGQTRLFVLGQHDALAEPAGSNEAPAETARVVGTGRDCKAGPNPEIVESEVRGPIEGIVPNGVGTGLIVRQRSETSYEETPSYVRVVRINTTERLAGAVSPRIDPPIQTVEAEEVIEETIYDSKKRLEFVESRTYVARVIIDPGVESLLTFPALAAKSWTNYYYDDRDVVVLIDQRQWSARKAVYADATQPFDPVSSGRKIDKWTERRPDTPPTSDEPDPPRKYSYTLTDLKPLAQIKPDAIEEEDDAYRLTSDPRQSPPDPNTQPPATQYYQGREGPEVHFKGEAKFAYPYPAVLKGDRVRTWQISPAVSKAQCEEVAEIKGKMLWGSRFAVNLEVAQDSGLANLDAPYWRFDVQTPAVPRPGGGTPLEPQTTSAYLCDSVVWSHGRDDGDRVHLYGIYLGAGSGSSITPPYGRVRDLLVSSTDRISFTKTSPLPINVVRSLLVSSTDRISFTRTVTSGGVLELFTGTWIFSSAPPATFTPPNGSAITVVAGMTFSYVGDPSSTLTGITAATVTYAVVKPSTTLEWRLVSALTQGSAATPTLPDDDGTAPIEHTEVVDNYGSTTITYKQRVAGTWYTEVLS